MKIINNVYYKHSKEEVFGVKVSDMTFYDLITKGKIAKRNLIKTLKRNFISVDGLIGVRIDNRYISINY